MVVSSTQQAMALIQEMHSAQQGTMPKYNEETFSRAEEEMSRCDTEIGKLLEEAKKESALGIPEPVFEWASQPERFAAVVVHHETILRLKRILLTYTKMRVERLRAIWLETGGHLPQDVKDNLSPAEIEYYHKYASCMTKYMGPSGIGMDLTQYMTPPKDTTVTVQVLRDHGTLATRYSGKVALTMGSKHCLQLTDAEPLIRLGVVRPVDGNY